VIARVKIYAAFGFVFYWGVYLLLTLLELVPGVLYRFGYVNYDFGNWAHQQIVNWVWLPAIYVILKFDLVGYRWLFLTINTIFWVVFWLVYGLLYLRVVKLIKKNIRPIISVWRQTA